MLKNFERYNKLWGALIPLVAWFIPEYLGADVTPDQVRDWSNDLILLLSPIFAWWMRNEDKP